MSVDKDHVLEADNRNFKYYYPNDGVSQKMQPLVGC